MGRGMIKKEIQALETASLEFFRNGKTETIPHDSSYICFAFLSS